MSFFVTPRLFVQSLLKSESIFKNLVKSHIYPSSVVDKYINEIKEIQFHQSDTNVSEYLEFPFKTFYALNKDSIKYIISKTFDLIKEQGLGSNPMIYSCVLKAYLQYDIEIDIENVLQDIIRNGVPLNKEICNKIIEYYCNHGEMSTVEILLNEMKSQKIYLQESNLFGIVSGYIIDGQPEKAENFINERNLNPECHFMFYSRCYGYASSGDVASLKNVLAEMKKKDVKFVPYRYFSLYERLVHANVDISVVEEIIDLTKNEIAFASGCLFTLVASLNRADHYFNYSVFLIDKLITVKEDISKFIQLFSTSRCPPTIFQQFITILEPRIRSVSYSINIFGDMSFDTAFGVSQNFTKCTNWKLIFYSLINKAVCEKSLPDVENALNFSFKHLKVQKMNILMSQCLLPSMLNSGMVSNYDEILDLLPTFRNQILQVLLMKYLCCGDFDQYNNLRLQETHMTNIFLKSEYTYLVSELRNNLVLINIEQWSMEARKCFHSEFIDNVLENLVVYETITLLKNKSINEFKQLIDHAKESNVRITNKNFKYLLQTLPEHYELLHNVFYSKAESTSVD